MGCLYVYLSQRTRYRADRPEVVGEAIHDGGIAFY